MIKQSIFMLLSTVSLVNYAACNKTSEGVGNGKDSIPTGNKMTIRIGDKRFTATLYDNNTVRAFIARLPMTVSMTELNGNEKYYDLPAGLPTNSSNPGTIHNGDLMLYGTATLVLFYKGGTTTYNYTRLGRIDSPNGLQAALGNGSVTVAYERE